MAPSAASKVDASVAYPGYAKQRRRVEAQIRRARPGPSSLSRAFAVLARVLLATLLLPFDLLLGDALRTGRLARPAMGAAGAALAGGSIMVSCTTNVFCILYSVYSLFIIRRTCGARPPARGRV